MSSLDGSPSLWENLCRMKGLVKIGLSMATKKLSTVIRRGQIIRAALNIIEHEGVKGLTIGKIASSTGLVPSAIYRHFNNKEQIIDASLELVGTRLLNSLNQAVESGGSSLETLQAILFSQVEVMEELSFVFLRMLLSEESCLGDGSCGERVKSIFTRLLGTIEEVITLGQVRGEIREGLAPNRVALMFLGLYQSPSFFYLLDSEHFDPAEQARESWPLFQRAISPV